MSLTSDSEVDFSIDLDKEYMDLDCDFEKNLLMETISEGVQSGVASEVVGDSGGILSKGKKPSESAVKEDTSIRRKHLNVAAHKKALSAKSALYFLKTTGSCSMDILSTQQKERYNEAINLLKNDDFLRPSNEFDVTGLRGKVINEKKNVPSGSSVAKRNRSMETAERDGKKARDTSYNISEAVSVRDVVKNLLLVCIIDNNHPEGFISDGNWFTLKDRIGKAILSQCRQKPNLPAPRFNPSGWNKGFRITECKDQWSLDFLRAQVACLDGLWEGARLDVVHKDDIPSKPRARVRIIEGGYTKDDVQTMLRLQNPEIAKDDIVVSRCFEHQNMTGQQFTLELGTTALSAIEMGNGSLNFGMGVVTVNILDKGEKPTTISTNDGVEDSTNKPPT